MQEHASAQANAKVILFGEHAVVYGQPAVAAALPVGVDVDLTAASQTEFVIRTDSNGERHALDRESDQYELLRNAARRIADKLDWSPTGFEIEIDNSVPVGVGLGASAAFSLATARAISSLVDAETSQMFEAAMAGETVFHGKPSGVDLIASKTPGVVFFHGSELLDYAPVNASPFDVLIGVTDQGPSTGDMIERVSEFKQEESRLVDQISQTIGDVARRGVQILREGRNEQLGRLFDANHGALSALGVTTEALDVACHRARRAGAYGAKMTGAGGGGAVVALVGGRIGAVRRAWEQLGLDVLECSIPARDGRT